MSSPLCKPTANGLRWKTNEWRAAILHHDIGTSLVTNTMTNLFSKSSSSYPVIFLQLVDSFVLFLFFSSDERWSRIVVTSFSFRWWWMIHSALTLSYSRESWLFRKHIIKSIPAPFYSRKEWLSNYVVVPSESLARWIRIIKSIRLSCCPSNRKQGLYQIWWWRESCFDFELLIFWFSNRRRWVTNWYPRRHKNCIASHCDYGDFRYDTPGGGCRDSSPCVS